jgi:hypothetical protein
MVSGAKFRLQSQDDVVDAPIELPDVKLLHNGDRTAKKFYRERINLEEHGTAAVLKDTLRQIGSDNLNNPQLLEYVAKYFEDTVEFLKHSSEPGHKRDADELDDLFVSARLILCTDDEWRPITQCKQAWDVAAKLQSQGWKKNELNAVLTDLLFPHAIASIDSKDRKIIQKVCDLSTFNDKEIADFAITSDSKNFSLEQRIKIVSANWNNSLSNCEPSEFLRSQIITTLSGECELDAACFLEVHGTEFPNEVAKYFVPNAVDLEVLTKHYELSNKSAIKVLLAFGIDQVSSDELRKLMTAEFANLWPSIIPTEERLQLLSYIGRNVDLIEALQINVLELDVACISINKGEWSEPDNIVAPLWRLTNPPLLPEYSLTANDCEYSSVQKVWDHWCGLNSAKKIIYEVIRRANELKDDKRNQGAKELYKWFDNIISDKKISHDDLIELLDVHKWVLAQKADDMLFLKAADVLFHNGQDILRKEFWVPACDLPRSLKRKEENLGFKDTLNAEIGTVEKIGNCLLTVTKANLNSLISVYELTAELLAQNDKLIDVWQDIAQDKNVFSLYRNSELKVSNNQLFLGNKNYSEDIGELLFCLKGSKTVPNKILSLYGKLGVEKSPTVNHLLWALSNLNGEYKKVKPTYEQLIDSLISFNKVNELNPDVFNFNLKILSCANTFESLQDCYFNDDFGKPQNIEKDSRKFLINSGDRVTRKLLNWLEENIPDKIIRLSDVADTNLKFEPDEIGLNPLVTQILGPWKDFIREVIREGALFRDDLVEIGIDIPKAPVKISAVDILSIEFHLPDGQVISQSDKWKGVPAYFDKKGNLFVQYSFMEKSKTDSSFLTVKLDRLITQEIVKWLVQDYQDQDVVDNEKLSDLILKNLERPSNLLSQIKKDNQRYFFHQYNDQVADPEFAALFEKYRKTREGSDQHKQLAEEMKQIFLRENVKARRDDIRGYGYDEFSVFAELVQNAEDAYVQRDWLKMDNPHNYSVLFKYQQDSEEENLKLSVEHYGRPFNYWRHGALENENLKRDVEGVLRSKGSYKPHGVDTSDEKTIGRFGLGFKSVFLVTDCPIIHSENWHFSIEACCLPNELKPPSDFPPGATRIVLPLNSNEDEIEDLDGKRLINLMPFLQKINSLNLKRSDGSELHLTINKKDKLTCPSIEVLVEKVHISGASHTRGNEVRFLRFRHPDHNGQLAICISGEMLPVPWDEVFHNDFHVVLPLKVKLGCGVAISHLFEIQSGRTHLIEHQENKIRINEVAELISAFPQALGMLLNEGNSLRAILLHFWNLWRWDKGDSEGNELRKALAKQLVVLAEKNEVIPTLRGNEAVMVGNNVLFHFSQNIPDQFIDALIKFNVEFQGSEEEGVSLTLDNVVSTRVSKIFVKTCNFAEVGKPDYFKQITWEEIGEVFIGSKHFAELPLLFNSLASCLSVNQVDNVREWLPRCLVCGVDDEGYRQDAYPKDLLLPAFSAMEKLPKRLLSCLDRVYSNEAIKLLKVAGLRNSPPVAQIQKWVINKELGLGECYGLLEYLVENGRFRTHYHSLKPSMTSQWIPHENTFLTITEAKDKSLLDDSLFTDGEFRAWLGLWENGESVETDDETEQPDFDAQAWLEKLFDWWVTNGNDYTRKYEQGVYPQGKPFNLQTDFLPSDRSARREWLSLFLLGSFHTMGWNQPGANRNFLSECENKGWLQVFADPNSDAARWIDVLESYLDGQIGEAKYHQWVKQFVSIFQLARWLDGYVDLFLDMEKYTKDFSMNDLLISRESIAQQGGGVDAPPLIKTLGIGANFVIRELLRNHVIVQPLAHRHSFVPILRVRNIMKRLGCEGLDDRFGGKIHY